jgi:phosphatidylglycerophosphatase A
VKDRDGRLPAWPVTLIATSFGAGFMPKAPGHTGTLTAVPLAWALGRGGHGLFIAGLAAISAIGTWAAGRFLAATGRDDDQRIVVDEVAGYLVTLALVERTGPNLFFGYFLFRLFDVWKPWPVRWADRRVGGGLGVMLDDLLAGVYGALALFLLVRAGLPERAFALVASVLR